jgi:hypothetical protein
MVGKKGSKPSKGGKYARELERLRELNTINEVLKKSDIENAALLNTSKDSESVSDSAVNNMLDQLNINKNSNKDLELIESLTRQGAAGKIASKRHIRVSGTRRGVRVTRKVHLKKLKNRPKKGKKKKR